MCVSAPTSELCVAFSWTLNINLIARISVQAALDHLSQRSDIDTSRILVFGRSLGGAVGSMLAKNNPDKVPLVYYLNLYIVEKEWN